MMKMMKFQKKKKTPNQIKKNPTRHALLAYLSIINLLLHRMIRNQPINEAILLLTVPIDAADRLRIMARIPRSVQNNNSIRADQIYAQASSSRRQQEQPHATIRLVEQVNQALALHARRAPVQPKVALVLLPFLIRIGHIEPLQVLLDQIERQQRLTKQQYLIAYAHRVLNNREREQKLGPVLQHVRRVRFH